MDSGFAGIFSLRCRAASPVERFGDFMLTRAVGFPKLRSWYPYTGSLWSAPTLSGVRDKILDFSPALLFLDMFFSKGSAWLESHVWENTTPSIIRRDMLPLGIYMK